MTTTVDLPDDLVKDIEQRASQEGRPFDQTITDLIRHALAWTPARSPRIRTDAAMLEARELVARKFISGEWEVELAGFESGREADRKSAEARMRAWLE